MRTSLRHDGARSTVALIGMCMIGSAKAGGVRPDGSTVARRTSETPGIQSVHFSEILNGTDSATVLQAGGFKLTASCKTITYTYDSFHGGYTSSTSMYHGGYTSSTSMYHTFPSFPSSSSYYHGGHTSSFHGSHEGGAAEGPPHAPRHPHSSDDFGSTHSSGAGGGWHRGGGREGGDSGRGGGRGGDNRSPFSSSNYTSLSAAPTSAPMPQPGGPEGESEREISRYWSTYYTDDDSGYDGYGSSTHTHTHMHSDDDGSYSYHFPEEFIHTETIAALELTYTASDEDYLYGSPSYSSYPDETLLAGSYQSGESRTQIVFAGRDGSWGDTCTMQSMSGNYVSIGQSTVGVQRSWMEGTGDTGMMGEMENSSVFPEGVDCMVAGVVTFVESN